MYSWRRDHSSGNKNKTRKAAKRKAQITRAAEQSAKGFAPNFKISSKDIQQTLVGDLLKKLLIEFAALSVLFTAQMAMYLVSPSPKPDLTPA